MEMCIRKTKERMCIKLSSTESQLNDLVQKGRELRPHEAKLLSSPSDFKLVRAGSWELTTPR